MHAAGACLLLAGCAQRPEAVAPMPVSTAQYQDTSCADLGRQLAGLNDRIAELSVRQQSKRVTDTVGWIFFAVPMGSIGSSDSRPRIALHKGERNAVERVMQSRCQTYRS